MPNQKLIYIYLTNYFFKPQVVELAKTHWAES